MNHRMKSQLQNYYEFWFGLNEIYERWAKAQGLTSNTLFVLYTINEYPDHCTPSVLCKSLLLSKQTINSILNRLERDGYIERSQAQQDRRSRFITFTPEGKAYAKRILDALYQFEEEALSRLSEAQRSAMLDTSHGFLQEMRRVFPGPALRTKK